jgi:hypothetical protein
MNYKLILQLSLFGLAMSVATVFWIPSNIEPVFWLLIFFICAYFIAFKCSEKYFLTGFMVSIFNCVWIIAGHILFYRTYLTNHPQEAEMMTKMPILHHSPRLMMLITGPVIGIVSGLILGLFAFLGSKIIQKK